MLRKLLALSVSVFLMVNQFSCGVKGIGKVETQSEVGPRNESQAVVTSQIETLEGKEPKASGLKLPVFSQEEYELFLTKRTTGSFTGSFGSWASLLYAMDRVALAIKDEKAASKRLSCPYPKFYQPTWKEMFDVLARQTFTHWIYNFETGFWEFEPPALESIFEVEVAKGWRSLDRGNYISYIPEVQPVGMDVYMMGRYSVDEGSAEELHQKAREHAGTMFAKYLKKDVTPAEMENVIVSEIESLYFTCPAPGGDITWRQWAFVKEGWCFLIVSSLEDKNEEQLLPEIQKMISSFKLTGN